MEPQNRQTTASCWRLAYTLCGAVHCPSASASPTQTKKGDGSKAVSGGGPADGKGHGAQRDADSATGSGSAGDERATWDWKGTTASRASGKRRSGLVWPHFREDRGARGCAARGCAAQDCVAQGSAARGCAAQGCEATSGASYVPLPSLRDQKDNRACSRSSLPRDYSPPPCISYANVRNYYGPYAHCSLDKGVACAKHIQLPTDSCARMVWVHLDLCPHFQVYANTRQPWEHKNFRFTPMLAQAMKNAKPTNVRLGNPSSDHTPCGTIAHAHHLKMPLAVA